MEQPGVLLLHLPGLGWSNSSSQGYPSCKWFALKPAKSCNIFRRNNLIISRSQLLFCFFINVTFFSKRQLCTFNLFALSLPVTILLLFTGASRVIIFRLSAILLLSQFHNMTVNNALHYTRPPTSSKYNQ